MALQIVAYSQVSLRGYAEWKASQAGVAGDVRLAHAPVPLRTERLAGTRWVMALGRRLWAWSFHRDLQAVMWSKTGSSDLNFSVDRVVRHVELRK